MKKTRFFLFFSLLILACSPKTSATLEKTEEAREAPISEVLKVDNTARENVDLAEEATDISLQSDQDAVPSMPQAIPADEAVLMGSLENGMRYYIQQNSKPENRAELRLIVDAGSMQEDEDQLGVAHFVEHMAFNGSKNFAKNDLVDFLESIGSKFGPDLNAYTSFDETVYMLQVRTDSMDLFDKGLLVLSDWASGITFDSEEIDKERGVVTSEWRTGLSGEQRMQQEYLPLIYYNSRYARRLPIGTPEIINNVDYGVVRRFYKDWYRTDLMALAVVGDIDVEETERKIREVFGPIPASEVKREKADNVVPKHKETLVSINSDKEVAFTAVRLMYKHDHIPLRTKEDYRQTLVRQLYNRMLNARLTEITKEAEPPFIFAYSGYGSDVGNLDTYTSFANVPEGKIEAALDVLLTENERALRHGFNKTELERQKIKMMENMERQAREQDKIDSRRLVTRYVYNYLDARPIPSIDTQLSYYKEFLPEISVANVNQLAKKWITDENRVVVVTAPQKEDVPLPQEDALLSLVNNVAAKEIGPYEDVVVTGPLFDKELQPVAIRERASFDDVGVKEFKLENGIRLVLKPTDFKNDQVLMSASSEGGTSLYSDEDFIHASNAARIVSESGIGPFTETELEKLLIGKTVGVFPFIGSYREGISASCSPRDLETMFQLTHMYFTDVRKNEKAFKSFISKQANTYKNLMANPQYFFMNHTMKLKTNKHPRVGFPTQESLQAINHDRALEIYRERFSNAGDFTFIFVGNFDEDQLKELSQKYLGTLPARETEETFMNRNIDYVEGPIVDEIQMGEAPKTNVELFFHGPFEWTQENAFNFQAMIDVLAIKMRESMREDKGGVYGVRLSGNVSRIPEEGYSITVSFNCDPQNTEELIETAMNDVKNAKMKGAEQGDLTKVKETQRQSMIKNLEENRYWQSRLRFVYDYDLSPSSIKLETLEEAIKRLDSDDIKDAASQYFGSDNFIQMVMEPEKLPSN